MADIKNVLQQIKDSKDGQENLYNILQKVFTKILLESPKNAFDVFEDYVYNVKFNKYDPKSSNDNAHRLKENYNEIQQFLQQARLLYNKINLGTEEEPQEPGPCGYVPNFLEESKLFEQIGIYFGEDETYRIFKSLSKLSITKQVKNVRFWGKILCSKKDYYVAEGVLEGGEDGQEYPSNVETRGNGVNKLNYWVTTDLFSDWSELPVVTPQQIITARKIKYMFTGDLEKNIITNPYFFGKEKHLLKAQIVRIAHSTTVVQKGIYQIVEDEDQNKLKEIEPVEEVKPNTFEELQSLSSWLHFTPRILNEGRIVHFPREFPEDVDAEQEMKKIVQKDPFEPRLKPLSADKPTQGFDQAWLLKTYGDTNNYDLPGKVVQKINYGIISLKSQIWPGFVILYSNKIQTSIYVGYGFKASNQLFYPKEPQLIQDEPEDYDDYPEPNFPQEEQDQKQQDDDNGD